MKKMQPRPRRSVLYMPGSNARAIEKARSLDVDCVILDLEDAVSPSAKISAREQVVSALAEGGFGAREMIVRVNALDTEWGLDDLKAVARSEAAAVLLSKVSRVDDIDRALAILEEQGCSDELAVWIMAETPEGILNINSICKFENHLAVVVLGTNDLAKELRVVQTPGREALLTSLSLCVLAARANGLDIIDGVYNVLDDDEGLLAACTQGACLGFDGKTLIHPKQLLIANQVFAPTPEILEWAAKIINAWETEREEGVAVITVEGQLVEELHIEDARRNLALQASIDNAR